MIFIITVITLILFGILIIFTLHNLSNMIPLKKVIYIIIGIIMFLIITIIFFNISKTKVNYPNVESMQNTRTILILIFTPINGIIFMPFIASILNSQTVCRNRRNATTEIF